MKKRFGPALCLVFILLQSQQQKPATDTSWSEIKKSMSNLSRTVKEVKKQSAKKTAELKAIDSQVVFIDTLYVDLTHEDSVNIYVTIKNQEEASTIIEKKKITSVGKFLRSLTGKKKKN